MKYNETAVLEYSFKPADKEGRLYHKVPSKSSIYSLSVQKERWFKLVGNILFYFRLNQDGVVVKEEPNGMFVLENTFIEYEVDGVHSLPHGFSIKWKEDPFNKHIFFANCQKNQSSWITSLLTASYSNLRAELFSLRMQIRNISGKDPLEHMGSSMKKLPHMKDTVVSKPLKYASSFSTSEWYIPIADVNISQTTSAPATPVLPKIPPRNKSKKNNNEFNGKKCNRPNKQSFISHIKKEDVLRTRDKEKPPTNLMD